MKKKHIFIILGILIFGLAASIFRPVNIPKNASECLVATGKVISVFEGGTHDIAFRLEGDKTVYYINRGMEMGLDLKQLKDQLTGNQVTIRYPKHWTLLDPNNTIKHLCILEFNGKELFNEIEIVNARRG